MVYIYVLKLKGNKYYVGKTTNVAYRLTDHFKERGSEWTKTFKPISIHELRPDCRDVDEQIITQEYMVKFGIDNVRGGPWCKMKLGSAQKQLILGIIQSNADACYKCGGAGHFASNCGKRHHIKSTIHVSPSCTRCGRSNHIASRCYAGKHIAGHSLYATVKDQDDIESYDSSDGESSEESDADSDGESDADVWCCSFCDKEFATSNGANYHERMYCRNNTNKLQKKPYYKRKHIYLNDDNY
jgi:predicted GIY-YIG superfamily endonuclease